MKKETENLTCDKIPFNPQTIAQLLASHAERIFDLNHIFEYSSIDPERQKDIWRILMVDLLGRYEINLDLDLKIKTVSMQIEVRSPTNTDHQYHLTSKGKAAVEAIHTILLAEGKLPEFQITGLPVNQVFYDQDKEAVVFNCGALELQVWGDGSFNVQPAPKY
ncbi:hypothetical protein A2Z23_01150 [Candidatus Curtissbacteria bacterium RBG_16_39_7]|uniref:Uncharacterized protein n=1 Tax=Candidatus Curtissbacteria bacterium RBG_16_39_7 TaxID=1797707 RepID=A0A1F5G2D5_9BACT|nr:MAG: hypothetical protein A2Z23_01150 [Candidatus Curtissbacteria bacterium RBG_16_39_7]